MLGIIYAESIYRKRTLLFVADLNYTEGPFFLVNLNLKKKKIYLIQFIIIIIFVDCIKNIFFVFFLLRLMPHIHIVVYLL